MSLSKSLFTVLLLLALPTAFTETIYAQGTLESQTKALNVIEAFANKLCASDSVRPSGITQKVELSGNAKAELAGVIKKIIDLGIKTAAKYQGSSYEGVLQADLAKLLTDRTNCKLQVFNSLKDKLIPNPSSSSDKTKSKQMAADQLSPPPNVRIEQRSEGTSSSNTAVIGNNNIVTVNPKPSPRRIHTEERRNIIAILAANRGKVSVAAIVNDLEAYQLQLTGMTC